MRDQVRPPSLVTKARPSAVVTVAFSPSIAVTDRRFTASGKATRRQRVPFVVSNTVPDGPISQHTDGEGDAPATA